MIREEAYLEYEEKLAVIAKQTQEAYDEARATLREQLEALREATPVDRMEAAVSEIEKELAERNYPTTVWNILTIRTALEWLYREDWEPTSDAINYVIDDQELELRR